MSDPSAEDIAAAVRALKRGEVVVFPTETFYGLGADALSAAAVERIVALKGRSADSPIAVIVADRAMLAQIAAEVSPAAEKLMKKFWPGPLTLIFPARPGLHTALLNPEGKIGARVSSHPVAAELSRALGRPITATSANPSGSAPARTSAEARAYFGDRSQIVLDGGTLAGGQGSTVAEAIGREIKIIRAGAIGAEELRGWL